MVFNFPCHNPTGYSYSTAELVGVLDALGLAVQRQTLRQRPSSRGNYVSVTVAYEAHSRDDYDALYGALRACPAVKYIL